MKWASGSHQRTLVSARLSTWWAESSLCKSHSGHRHWMLIMYTCIYYCKLMHLFHVMLACGSCGLPKQQWFWFYVSCSCDCDEFTKQYYSTKYGVREFEPIPMTQPPPEPVKPVWALSCKYTHTQTHLPVSTHSCVYTWIHTYTHNVHTRTLANSHTLTHYTNDAGFTHNIIQFVFHILAFRAHPTWEHHAQLNF